jgi:hypothetical protein
MQSATFAEAPGEARRLIRRKQRGYDTKMLDRGQYGYLASRTAILHPNGGQWTLSRAIGEALPQLEAVEREQGIAFGDLVRERRRQRGLPLPIAERVLPFRPPSVQMDDRGDDLPEWPMETAMAEPPAWSMSVPEDALYQGGTWSTFTRWQAEVRMRATFDTLQAAEASGVPARQLAELEAAFAREVAAYAALDER